MLYLSLVFLSFALFSFVFFSFFVHVRVFLFFFFFLLPGLRLTDKTHPVTGGGGRGGREGMSEAGMRWRKGWWVVENGGGWRKDGGGGRRRRRRTSQLNSLPLLLPGIPGIC